MLLSISVLQKLQVLVLEVVFFKLTYYPLSSTYIHRYIRTCIHTYIHKKYAVCRRGITKQVSKTNIVPLHTSSNS